MTSNPAIALWLQFTRPAGRVAELGSFGGVVAVVILILMLMLAIVAGVFAWTVTLILRIGGGVWWWSAFSVLVLGGLTVGLVVSLRERQDSPTRRVVGWPFPAAVFKLEHGDWVDYVTPPPIAVSLIALDSGLVASGALLPLLGAAWFYPRHRSRA